MTSAFERVRTLVAAAARIAEPGSELGRRARAVLPASTGLSPENVEWALRESLETAPSAAELEALCGSVEAAPAAHVVLPANVFVAAHRAIALGLAASPRVFVRPSRREPHFARLLAEAAPGLFELVATLAPVAGDAVWAYGADTSLAAVRAALAPGVTLHAHGPGFGVAVIDGAFASPESARDLASDLVPFDQRGCLSPRVALVLGDPAAAQRFARMLAGELAELARQIPLGTLSDDERADAARFRDAALYAGTLLPAGPGALFVTSGRATPAPVGRNLCVAATAELEAALAGLGPELVTAVGFAGPDALSALVERALPGARVSALGKMQRPRFDGGADRRG